MRHCIFAILCLPGFCLAQDFSPAPPFPPSATVLKDIAAKTEQLGAAIAELRKQGLRDPDLADVAVYHRAARMIVAHNEFFAKSSGADTVFVLEQGLERAKELAQGHMPWTAASGTTTIRGYASRVDGSPQPYAVTLPVDYGKDANKRWRVDVVLHGRNQTLTEVGFIRTHGDKPAPKGLDYVRIDVFGRGNNAYRWAGETDVLETIDSFFADERAAGRERLPDPARVVLRGFSMGGAGTWHLGLHYPDRWCVIGPGAGFTTTHGYVAKLPKPLPPHQEACLRIYDAIDYAENAFNVPIVAYSGALDKQKAAADNIERLLEKHKLSITHLIAPDVEHQFPPAWQAKADSLWRKHAERGLAEYPPRVKFVTYTMKYPGCMWAEILGMQRHYEKAGVDAKREDNGFTVATQNVRVLHLLLPKGAMQPQQVRIDGQGLTAKPWTLGGDRGHLYLERRGDAWYSVLPQRLVTLRQQRPQKITGLQGPIDDAFTDGFVCVRGTGKPWHDATERYAEANLKRFEAEWSKYLRGDLPIKNDVDVTNEDIATKNLILFGDPASNVLIAQVADRLPLQWDREKIALAGKEASSADHVPVLIHPSPLNASRYVVLNSGHTFHAPEFRGTNALLFPRLGDYALLRLNPTAKDALGVDVIHAGLFDEYWSINR